MRITNLNFRSPKEFTPGYLYPSITRRGNVLRNKSNHCTFSKESRFSQYIQLHKINPYTGPGTYEPNHKLKPISAKMVLTPYSSNQCIMVGYTIQKIAYIKPHIAISRNRSISLTAYKINKRRKYSSKIKPAFEDYTLIAPGLFA